MFNNTENMHPKFEEAINFHKKGDLLNANNLLLKILKENPKDIDVLHLLGIIAFQSRNYEKSINFFNDAIKINNQNPEIYKNLSIVFQRVGKFKDALKCCDEAINIKNDYVEAYNHKGHILTQTNNYDLAIKNWKKALEINPQYFEVFNNLGNVYSKLNKLDLAIDFFNKAIEIKINFPDAYINRAFVLKELKKYDLALKDCDKAINLKPDFAEAYNNKAIILREIKKIDLAYENYKKAFEINPKLDFLFGSLIYSKINLGIWKNFDQNLKDLKEKINDGNIAVHPFSSLLLFDSPSLHKILAEKYLKLKYQDSKEKKNKLDINNANLNKKIRIGYYSADFCNHPVSNLIANLFENHDKSKFEIIGFYFGIVAKDEMLNRITNAFDKFYDVGQKNEDEIANLSRNLKIDIAVDLMGFTEKNRFGIFTKNCAPIQINYLGYPGTSGSSHIDYIIADKVLIPKESQKFYSEKIIYLPNTYQANDETKKISSKIINKNDFFLPNESFVFCCFNKNQKINPRIFNLWSRILNKIENSILWLLDENFIFKQNIRIEAEKRNIDPDRIIFAKKIPLDEHLARHKLADLFLDTIPYGAHTTSSDALRSGLPLITLMGNSFASRVSASLLHAVGLKELITTTEIDYENLAVELALNPLKLSEIKKKLENNIKNKSLFNTKLFSKNLELAYEKIYQRNIKNLPAKNIE